MEVIWIMMSVTLKWGNSSRLWWWWIWVGNGEDDYDDNGEMSLWFVGIRQYQLSFFENPELKLLWRNRFYPII